ncbi:MAG: UDP-N-acetylmuramyl-tripeptide synthetase [Candidatus Komeilibacteria bacterium]
MYWKTVAHKIIPDSLTKVYHWLLAQAAARQYHWPSESMIVIAITGTSGKSTTCEILWQILQHQGYKVGLASGIRFFDGVTSASNNTKMTMLGRFRLQKLLAQMKTNGCQYAIIETTSLGLSQYRHLGINIDVAAITNFWSEHDEAHGGLEQYRAAKGQLFHHLTTKPRKTINGKTIDKISVLNADDDNYHYFAQFTSDKQLAFSLQSHRPNTLTADKISYQADGCNFAIENIPFHLPLLGSYNVTNALTAITIASGLGVSLNDSAAALRGIAPVPGRLEYIDEGQDFTVIVDYAFEPKAMTKLYEVIIQLPHNKVIHVLGTTGGGRDAKRGGILGAMAADFADIVIATDEDPYDDDPLKLIQRVATGAQNKGKELDKNLFIKRNRLDGITKAVDLAQPGDIVLITGKGSEGAMAVANGKKIAWDDREVARAAIQNKTKR